MRVSNRIIPPSEKGGLQEVRGGLHTMGADGDLGAGAREG